MKRKILISFCLTWMPLVAAPAFGQTSLEAPDGSTVLIDRDEFGVPHVVAENEQAAFFAQGFVSGADRFLQLEAGRRIAEGRVSEIPLPVDLPIGDTDRQVLRDFYRPEERRRQFEELPAETKAFIEAYTDGVNRFLDSMAVNPVKYKPLDVALLEQLIGGPFESWTVFNTVAVAQFMLRQFGSFGGTELERLKELNENGREWFETHRPINDPEAPTTIPPGETGGGIPEVPSGDYRTRPSVDPAVIDSIRSWEEGVEHIRDEYGIPNSLGSFAVLVSPERTENGGTMLLGAPQMGTPDSTMSAITYEIELQSPTLHIGGIAVPGIPGIIIGRNPYHAWSFTSGVSDAIDVFIETTEDASFGRYLHDGEWLEFETYVDTIYVDGEPTEFEHHRTIHGPVIGSDLENRQVFTRQYAVWEEELDAFAAFDKFWRSDNLEDFSSGAEQLLFSFNLFYADLEGNIAFWHTGRYPDRSDGIDPRLPRLGDGSEEWQGFRPPSELPHIANPAQGYLVNWNNKPSVDWDQGDNVPWAFDNELDTDRGTDRVLVIDDIVGADPSMTFGDLQQVTSQMTEVCESEREEGCFTRGTYEQLLSFGPNEIEAVNILPPGQIALPISPILGLPRPHSKDQWPLFRRFEYKTMRFGERSPVASERFNQIPDPCGLDAGSCGPHILSTFPNPFADRLTIEFDLNRPAEVTFKIFDVLGREVWSRPSMRVTSGSHEIHADLGHLGDGLYFVVAESEGGRSTGRVMQVR